MRRLGILGAVATWAAWALCAHASPPALAAYGRLPSVSDVEISPDGTKLAMLVGDETSRQLQIRDVSDHKVVTLAPLGAVKVRALQWAGEEHLLIVTSVTDQPFTLLGPKREFFMLGDFNLSQGRVHPLMQGQERALNSVQSLPTVVNLKGRQTAFVGGVYFPTAEGVTALYRIDLDSGRTTRIADGSDDILQYLVDADGELVARAQYRQKSGAWTLWLHRDGSWKPGYSEISLIDHPDIVGLGSDGRSVLVRVHGPAGWSLHQASVTDGSWSEVLPEFTDTSMVHDPSTHRPIGFTHFELLRNRYVFQAPADQAAWDAVTRAFADEEVRLASWSDDRKHIVVMVEGARDGASYFVVDMTTGKADWLADEYAGVPPEALADKTAITYAAADGLKIPAYLTVPRGNKARTLPAVVLLNSGSEGHNGPGFDWWAQALASRGYAVLQPQYRGSDGFGMAHLEAGYGQWGRKMQTDLSDGVRHLAARGVIDPTRVCIVGVSYGGYAALAGATLDTGVYHCAVDVAGSSDLRQLLDYEDEKVSGRRPVLIRHFDRFLGVTGRNDPKLSDLSPVDHTDRVTIPILIIQGEDDTVVPYGQSREMVNALKRAGKPVEFVTLKGEDHWLSRSETRLQMLSAMVAFLEKNNPPDPVSALTPVAPQHAAGEPTVAPRPGAEKIASGAVSH